MPIPVLVTAFEPFDGRSSNTSMRVVTPMLAQAPEGVAVRVLPVDFEGLRKGVTGLLRSLQPQTWLLLGEAPGEDAFRCERIARNFVDRDRPDNAGRLAPTARVVRGGPDAYFTTLDPDRMRLHLEAQRVPARLSEDAGDYACNLALYLALHHARRAEAGMQIGFIHVPRQYRRTGRSLAELREAVSSLTLSLRDGSLPEQARRPVRRRAGRPRT